MTVAPSLVVATALTSLRARRLGWSSNVISVEGSQPRLVGGGTVRIGSRLALRCTQGPVELGAVSGATLDIGDRVFVNHSSTMVAHVRISIGDDCRIGELVGILDTDHHPLEPEASVCSGPVEIGRNVWIGRAAIVLPSVTIGDDAVVAAGSVVVHSVPPATLVAGCPARVVRELRTEAGWRRP